MVLSARYEWPLRMPDPGRLNVLHWRQRQGLVIFGDKGWLQLLCSDPDDVNRCPYTIVVSLNYYCRRMLTRGCTVEELSQKLENIT